jgi:integrase/recombinase XerD
MKETVERFLEHLQHELRYSGNTVAAYRNDLTQFSEHLSGKGLQRVEDLRRADVLSFALDLRERGYAASTVARKLASVRSFCHFLVREGLLSSDPSEGLNGPPVARRLPRTLSDQEMAQLLEVAGRRPTAKGLRDRAILELMYDTGIRVSELVSLDLGDVDLAKGTVVCGAGSPAQRTLSLSQSALQALAEYIRHGREQLLVADPAERALFLNHRGERLSRQGLWVIVKAYVRALGLEEGVTPHTLRHSAATHKLKRGAKLLEVQQLLGHSSPASTQVYARLAHADELGQ